MITATHNTASTDSRKALAERVPDILSKHFEAVFNQEKLWWLARLFAAEGYVKLPDLIPNDIKEAVQQEVYELLDQYAVRRDVEIKETGSTPRRMSNVSQNAIARHGHIIPVVYRAPPLLDILGKIAQDELTPTPWEDEEYIITRQEKAGDTHGWHWGDYPNTLIWVIKAPPIEYGGMLQCIPHTTWDKKSPQVNEHLVSSPIRTYDHRSGDIYFLRSDTTLHRTVPLTKDSTRIILNTCWAGKSTHGKVITHETMMEGFV